MVNIDQKPLAPDAVQENVGKRIVRATGALMVIQVVMRFFGVIEKSILGHVLGTTFPTDAYNAAKDFAFFIFQLVDQVTMHSFLPVFVQRMKERGDEDAWRLASTVLNILVFFVVIIAGLCLFFTPQLLSIAVPEWLSAKSTAEDSTSFWFSLNMTDLTILLTRAMLVSVIFLATSSLTYCLLNSYKRFALPASADIALKATVLIFAVIFIKPWGVFALAAGFVVGAAAKLLVHVIGLRMLKVPYRASLDLKHPGLKTFGLLALPLLAGVLVSIVRQMMDLRFASALSEGSYSAIKFAKTITDVPVSFFPFVFGIALFPFLADIAAAGDREKLKHMLMMASRMMLLVFIPLILIFFLLREPIVMLLYSEKSILAAEPLQIFALTMLVGALEIIVLQFYFAMSDTIRPTVMGIVVVPLHIAVSYCCIFVLGWGIISIPLALLISKGTKITILYAMIRKKLGELEGRNTMLMIGKVALAMIPLAVVLLLAVLFVPDPGAVSGKVKKILALMPYFMAALIGGAGYIFLLHRLRVDEVSLLLDKVMAKIKKKKAPVSA